SSLLHLGQQQTAGDMVFLVLLLFFLGRMATRARSAQELPPPHFVLVFFEYFIALGRLFKKPSGPPFMAQCFRLGALLLVAGLLLPAALPGYRMANLHLTFIGGFTIILFTVSTRVVLGHSGHAHLFQRRLRFLIASLGLLVLAMFARVSADFIL